MKLTKIETLTDEVVEDGEEADDNDETVEEDQRDEDPIEGEVSRCSAVRHHQSTRLDADEHIHTVDL